MYVSENDPNVVHDISLGPKRQAYLICIEGGLRVTPPVLFICGHA